MYKHGKGRPDGAGPPVSGASPKYKYRLEDFNSREFDMRLMVVGRTGAGKSSVANCILGKDRFQVGTGFRSTTTECQVDMVTRMGKRIRVLDTCGMFDTKRPHKEVEQEIRKSHLMIAPGPHAFLLVVPVEQFTEEHQKSVKRLEHIFPNFYQFTVIIFSKAHQLKQAGHTESFEDVLAEAEELKTLCCKVSDRYVLFDCTQKDKAMLEQRVYQVLDQVCCLYHENHCRHYRSNMFTHAETIAASMDEEIVREASTIIKSENEEGGGNAVVQHLLEKLPSNMKNDFNAEGPDKQPKDGSEEQGKQLEKGREHPANKLMEQLLGRLVLISDMGRLNTSSGRLAPEFRLPD